MTETAEPTIATRGREALDRHAWREAYDLLADADARGELSPRDLELLARAAWWTGQLPVSIEVRERVYAAAMKANDLETAAFAAISLARDNLFRVSASTTAAWLNRAESLLADIEEGVIHGWLAATRSFYAALTGTGDEALAHADRALEIARRVRNRNLEVVSMGEKGSALLSIGRVQEGLALIEEATVAAVGGDLDPQAAGSVCCTTIGACAAMGDWRRAAEWTEAQDRWCRREGINGYPGMCRIYRSEIKMLRGSWLEAEAEARRASEELLGFVPAAVGQAQYQLGEIRLRRGDLPAAEESLSRALEFGRDPEPALSLLRLAEGKIDAARSGIARALDRGEQAPAWWAPPGSDVQRLRILPAQVEIAVAAGDLETARAAAKELAEIATKFDMVAVRASTAWADGAVALAEGRFEEARTRLARAIELWTELDAPYDVARTRLLLADALRAQGDDDRAVIELRTARAALERLGAALDVRRADERLTALSGHGGSAADVAAAQRVERAFVFTDIVDSTRLAESLGDEVWGVVLRSHDQAIRSLVAEFGGEDVKAVGDGFFLAFDEADRAIDCAIGIQRRIDALRVEHDVSLVIRIGIHRAEAGRVGLDYRGTGVNQAARIGAEAQGGEILVSAPTLAAARRPFGESGRRTVQLRGISAPVEVVSIDWA